MDRLVGLVPQHLHTHPCMPSTAVKYCQRTYALLSAPSPEEALWQSLLAEARMKAGTLSADSAVKDSAPEAASPVIQGKPEQHIGTSGLSHAPRRQPGTSPIPVTNLHMKEHVCSIKPLWGLPPAAQRVYEQTLVSDTGFTALQEFCNKHLPSSHFVLFLNLKKPQTEDL